MPTVQSYHINLTGTPFENGKAMGNFVLNDKLLYKNLTDRLRWFDTYDKDLIDFEKIKACEKEVARRLPSYIGEIQGFTEATNISYEKYLYYFMFDWEFESYCSQFCILPDITKDNQVFSGHSWEWTMEAYKPGRLQTLEEDNIYVIRNDNAVPYMGFALNYFGLWNGMNAHGVSINPTGGVPLKESFVNKKLYNHGLLVRMILETCQSADEALEVINEFIPLSSGSGGGTLIVTDKSGTSYYIERAGCDFQYLTVGKDTDKQYQCAVSHFVNPHMFPYMSHKGVHSIVRYNALNTWIEAHKNQITIETLMEMQQRHLPDGPCCHYYKEYLGTLRSMVYNLTDLKAMICYGSPILNTWYAYDFDIHRTEIQSIETLYTNEKADPAIWKHIPPEE
jgi:predicted choloylglycine hydrolase